MPIVIADQARFRIALGDVLYDQRMLRNWSQDAMAFSIGISYASYRAWESGKSFPNMNNLLTICDLLQMRPSVMMAAAERRLAWAPRQRKKRGKRLPTSTDTEQCNVKHTR